MYSVKQTFNSYLSTVCQNVLSVPTGIFCYTVHFISAQNFDTENRRSKFVWCGIDFCSIQIYSVELTCKSCSSKVGENVLSIPTNIFCNSLFFFVFSHILQTGQHTYKLVWPGIYFRFIYSVELTCNAYQNVLSVSTDIFCYTVTYLYIL